MLKFLSSRYLITAYAVVLVDQISKIYFDQTFMIYERFTIIAGLFDFTLAYNEGAAFSFLADQSGWQRWLLSSVSLVVSIGLIIWMYKTPNHKKLLLWALALVLGGAVGNLIDRALYGYVVDFILLHWFDRWYYPAFNIADSAICIGAGLFLLDGFINPESKSKKSANQTDELNQPKSTKIITKNNADSVS